MGRVRLQGWALPFWPSGLTIRRSRPPTAAAELRALATKKGTDVVMNDFHLTWYMQEISMHAYGAEVDMTRIHDLLDRHETIQSRLVWFHLTSLLSHVGMISKLISPISRDATANARKSALKAALNVASTSEVLPRNARDNTEHFDERIDNWVSENATDIMEIVLPDRDGYKYLRVDEKRVRRVLLKQELVFISENRDGSKFELELKPLVHEVIRIGDEATKWIDAKSPYHFVYPR